MKPQPIDRAPRAPNCSNQVEVLRRRRLTRRYVGPIASESDFGRWDVGVRDARLPRPTAESLLEDGPELLLVMDVVEAVEERVETAKINGWMVVCEFTDARDPTDDIQACERRASRVEEEGRSRETRRGVGAPPALLQYHHDYGGKSQPNPT